MSDHGPLCSSFCSVFHVLSQYILGRQHLRWKGASAHTECMGLPTLGSFYFTQILGRRDGAALEGETKGRDCPFRPGAQVRRWMTIQAASGVAGFSIGGLTQVPMWLAPFAALALTSVIVPRASFVGHLSGILVGYMVGLPSFSRCHTCPCALSHALRR